MDPPIIIRQQQLLSALQRFSVCLVLLFRYRHSTLFNLFIFLLANVVYHAYWMNSKWKTHPFCVCNFKDQCRVSKLSLGIICMKEYSPKIGVFPLLTIDFWMWCFWLPALTRQEELCETFCSNVRCNIKIIQDCLFQSHCPCWLWIIHITHCIQIYTHFLVLVEQIL